MTSAGTSRPGVVDPAGRRAVALLSGGLDSGVATALWRAGGGSLALALCADYGQPAAEAEARTSRRLAERLGVPWRSLPMPFLGAAAEVAGSALSARHVDRIPARTAADPGDEMSAAAVWVPARNLVLLSAAAAWAEAAAADAVVVGFNREEASTFADNSAGFVAAADSALAFAVRRPLRIAAPTLHLDKRAIVAEARRLGFVQDDFWSCYLSRSTPASCACESCVRSRAAWGVAGG